MKKIVLLGLATLIAGTTVAQNVGVDVATPQQKLDVAGALKVGNTTNGVAGSLRWTGSEFQFHDGTQWVTLNANSDDQIFDIIQLSGNTLELSIENDGQPTHTIDLSPYLDNTDDQTFDQISINASNQLLLSLEGDGQPTHILDLSGYLDNTDDQTFDVIALNGTNLELSIENDGNATHVIDLSAFMDNTDDQTIDNLSLSGNTLQLSLEGDGQPAQTLDLSQFMDNTDDQTVDNFAIVGNTLQISLENDGQPVSQVNLAPYLDNTDDQQISLSGNDLTLEDGGTVNLASYLDNTDDQNLSGSLTGTTLEIDIEDGTTATVDLDPLRRLLIDADDDTKVEVEANADEDKVRITTAGTERMIVDETGNVGVGLSLTAPLTKLHVQNAQGSGMNYPLLIHNQLAANTGSAGSGIGFLNHGTNLGATGPKMAIYSERTADFSQGKLHFLLDNNQNNDVADIGDAKMTILSNGNVGVGTTDPVNTLHVDGTGKFSDHVYIGTTNGSSNDIYLADRIVDWDNTGYYVDPGSISRVNEVNFDDGSVTDPSVYFEDSNTGLFAPGAGQLAMTINGTEAVRVDASRNVGVGTTAPGQKLHVQGTGRFTDLAGTGVRSVYVEADGDLTTATPANGTAGYWTRTGNVVSPADVSDNIDLNGEELYDFTRMNSTPDATMPRIVLDSRGDGDNWTSQGAYISIGESGDLGAASMHMTYRGDGFGYIGSGAVSNAEPGASYLRFDYNANDIYTPDRLSIGTTSTAGQLTVAGRVEFTSTTDANGSAGSGVLEIGNGLRLDNNEVITNTNTALYLQNGNNGDLSVDGSTLFVDASANRVGVGTTGPSQALDINGSVRIRGGSPNPGDVLMATSTNGTATWARDGYGMVPIGSIVAWHKNMGSVPGLPAGWVECNGGTVSDAASPLNGRPIPNLNAGTVSQSGDASYGRFLRGYTTSGIFQGDQTNHLNWINHDDSGNGDTNDYLPDNGGTVTIRNYSTNGDRYQANLAGVETRVTNMSVVWIMRIK